MPTPDDISALAALDKAQSTWRLHRSATCVLEGAQPQFRAKDLGYLARAQCSLRVTIERRAWLEQQVRVFGG